MSVIRAAWRARWNAIRLAAAAAVVWVLAVDTPARLARMQLAGLPDADIAAEVRGLRERGHFAEALVVADAGLVSAGGETRANLEREREAARSEQQSWLRRMKDVARGAITGGGTGASADGADPSLELLLGAVATDLFVVGDIRDLVIQTGRWAGGEKTDAVIVALAGIGIATTLAPEIDWAPSLLKAVRKGGAMTDRFAQFIVGAAKRGDTDALRAVMTDTATIARHASPAGAVRLMRGVESAEDAAKLARFLARTGAPGARALRVTGEQGVSMARAAESLRAVGKVDEAIAVEGALVKASMKGKAGAAWLSRGLHRPLLRMHPLVGIAKSVWKGNAQALIARALGALDPFSAWVLPLAAAWAFLEAAMMLRRVGWGGGDDSMERWRKAARA